MRNSKSSTHGIVVDVEVAPVDVALFLDLFHISYMKRIVDYVFTVLLKPID